MVNTFDPFVIQAEGVGWKDTFDSSETVFEITGPGGTMYRVRSSSTREADKVDSNASAPPRYHAADLFNALEVKNSGYWMPIPNRYQETDSPRRCDHVGGSNLFYEDHEETMQRYSGEWVDIKFDRPRRLDQYRLLHRPYDSRGTSGQGFSKFFDTYDRDNGLPVEWRVFGSSDGRTWKQVHTASFGWSAWVNSSLVQQKVCESEAITPTAETEKRRVCGGQAPEESTPDETQTDAADKPDSSDKPDPEVILLGARYESGRLNLSESYTEYRFMFGKSSHAYGFRIDFLQLGVDGQAPSGPAWSTSEWGSCDPSTDTQTRTISCKDAGEPADDSECPEKTPPITRPCPKDDASNFFVEYRDWLIVGGILALVLGLGFYMWSSSETDTRRRRR